MHSPSSEPHASVFYTYKIHPYRHSPDMDSGRAGAPVVIVGAGPIGLATAIDLSRFGVASILLDVHRALRIAACSPEP
jgi:3-(3-hydroxy-phenyl)propionate hydroxylase